MTEKRKPQHLVVRFADALFDGIDTIGEHQSVVDVEGAVWFGKLGRPLAKHKIDLLNEQIDSRTLTYLYLVQRKGRAHSWTRGTLARVARILPTSDRSLVPRYYGAQGITKSIAIWFKITRFRKPRKTERQALHVVSSGRSVSEALWGSMAPLFLVAAGAPVGKGPVRRAQRPGGGFLEEPMTDALDEAILDAFEEDDMY